MPDAPARPQRGRRVLSPEAVAEARTLYETTDLSKTAIAARCGFSRSALYGWAAREGWRRQDAEAARRRMVSGLRARIEREIAGVEATLGRHAPLAQSTDAERAARTLASLVRTLRELAKYDQDQNRAAADEDADVVTDLDGLRDALADRLDRLRREHGG